MIFDSSSNDSLLGRRNSAANDSGRISSDSIEEVWDLVKSHCERSTIYNKDRVGLYRKLVKLILKSVRLAMILDNEDFLSGRFEASRYADTYGCLNFISSDHPNINAGSSQLSYAFLNVLL